VSILIWVMAAVVAPPSQVELNDFNRKVVAAQDASEVSAACSLVSQILFRQKEMKGLFTEKAERVFLTMDNPKVSMREAQDLGAQMGKAASALEAYSITLGSAIATCETLRKHK